MIAWEEFAGIVAKSARVPGVCFFTDLMNGIPPIVGHYAEHTSCLQELLMFVTVRTLPMRSVLAKERFLVAAATVEEEAEPAVAGVYRSVVQYAYMDKHDMEDDEFLESVVPALREVASSADEAETKDLASRCGVSIVIRRTILEAGGGHSRFKRFVIDHIYRFLEKNFRSNISALKMDHAKNLQVGMLIR